MVKAPTRFEGLNSLQSRVPILLLLLRTPVQGRKIWAARFGCSAGQHVVLPVASHATKYGTPNMEPDEGSWNLMCFRSLRFHAERRIGPI